MNPAPSGVGVPPVDLSEVDELVAAGADDETVTVALLRALGLD